MKSNIEKVKQEVKKTTSDTIIELIASQLDRRDLAKKRIEDEGIVVRDLKGSVVPHPALKIEQDATKIIADLLSKHKNR